VSLQSCLLGLKYYHTLNKLHLYLAKEALNAYDGFDTSPELYG